ncbi:MAG: radical SAM protein, partial [Gemmatimonadales bacterium]
PEAIANLNKRLDLTRFDRAAGFLADNGIGLRVFVLLGVPYIPRRESVESTVRAARYAADSGAATVSLIPVRGGNGELERLESLGHFTPPTLAQLETVLEKCLQFTGTVVTADLWDVERLPACEDCRLARVERIRRMNVAGRAERRVDCAACGVA